MVVGTQVFSVVGLVLPYLVLVTTAVKATFPGKNTGVGLPFPSPMHESEKIK